MQNQLKQVQSQEVIPNQAQEESSEVDIAFETAKKTRLENLTESLEVIKELKSKIDGLSIELKIRGEMIVERDNKIAELEKSINDLNAQISIFKTQIAPALEKTITVLRQKENELQATIDKQQHEIQLREERISASQSILQSAGMGKLLSFEESQIALNKKDKKIKEQESQIAELQSEVDQLPEICLHMSNEIKNRESKIQSLIIQNNTLNNKLKALENEIKQKDLAKDENLTQLSQQYVELQDQFQAEKQKVSLLDKELLILNSLILEKEAKITKLEEKIIQLIER